MKHHSSRQQKCCNRRGYAESEQKMHHHVEGRRGQCCQRGGSGDRGRGLGPRGMRGRARRGDVRLALLSLLAEQSANGYGLIKQIDERSGGTWKTSPGSVYPNLAQLVDEGLIVQTVGEHSQQNQYAVTEEGREYLANREEEIAALWQTADFTKEEVGPMLDAVRELKHVLKRIGRFGDPEQRLDATKKVKMLTSELEELLQ